MNGTLCVLGKGLFQKLNELGLRSGESPVAPLHPNGIDGKLYIRQGNIDRWRCAVFTPALVQPTEITAYVIAVCILQDLQKGAPILQDDPLFQCARIILGNVGAIIDAGDIFVGEGQVGVWVQHIGRDLGVFAERVSCPYLRTVGAFAQKTIG